MTHEFKEIISSYQKASQEGIRTVIATVVHVDGSSYRRPGVGMLILENGHMTGAVSGGCVEKEVWLQSQSVFATGTAKVMTYNGRYRLGCEGILYILIERFAPSNDTVCAILHNLASRIPFQMESYYTKDGESNGDIGSIVSFGNIQTFKFSNHFDIDAVKNNAGLACFNRTMEPCFKLIIIGSEHDAAKLSIMASATGWEVEVVNTPKSLKNLSDFPGASKIRYQAPEDLDLDKVDKQTAIILMTHNFAKDLLYLQAIKDTQPIYIGLLGPSRRREKLLSAFIEYFPDVAVEFMECIHGPAGLNLGAETPQEIAISIIAEILSVVRNQQPIPLQDKIGGIHGNAQGRTVDNIVINR
ncbi:XdhC family protein [Aquimarina sp. SS2-1]|uniref:XdhC family protein n=1 Tax=Aquimarina besae TaxID=3342247 RepID=UPI00366D6AAD